MLFSTAYFDFFVSFFLVHNLCSYGPGLVHCLFDFFSIHSLYSCELGVVHFLFAFSFLPFTVYTLAGQKLYIFCLILR